MGDNLCDSARNQTNVSVVNRSANRDDQMTERLDWQLSLHADRAWLASLVDALELVSRAEVAAVRCEPAVIAACERYLARPNFGAEGSVSRLLN